MGKVTASNGMFSILKEEFFDTHRELKDKFLFFSNTYRPIWEHNGIEYAIFVSSDSTSKIIIGQALPLAVSSMEKRFKNVLIGGVDEFRSLKNMLLDFTNKQKKYDIQNTIEAKRIKQTNSLF